MRAYRSVGVRYAARSRAMRARSSIEGTTRLISLDEATYAADLEGIGRRSDPAGFEGQFQREQNYADSPT